MIRLPDVDISPEVIDQLRSYQAEVDAVADYEGRIKHADNRFGAYNRKGLSTFDAVKVALTAMCSGAQRCAYCEDSAADEVEHIHPKSIYPERVFSWPNYLYACGPCNLAKNNQFAVFPSEGLEVVEVSRKQNDPINPPISGTPVFIDPRSENAMAWIDLDLRELVFVPRSAEHPKVYERARYSIEVLQLNRGPMIKARKEALKDYVAHLKNYVQAKKDKEGALELSDIQETITGRQHPTVWREMQRQHDKYPKLQTLFSAAPEAMSW